MVEAGRLLWTLHIKSREVNHTKYAITLLYEKLILCYMKYKIAVRFILLPKDPSYE